MKKAVIITLMLIIIAFNSCTTKMYVSNATNVPLLKQKGEVHVNITQNDLQAAVAFAHNFGVMANGFYADYKAPDNYRQYGMLGEAAIGYYSPLKSNLIFESYVGAGAGNIHKQQTFTDSYNNSYTASYNTNATKLFIQPDIGYKTKFFDAIFSTRISGVKYSKFSSQNYSEQQLENDYLDGNKLTGPFFVFAEPAVTLRGGYKFVKIQLQYGLTINTTPHDIRQANNFSSLGIVINIAKWYNTNNGYTKIEQEKRID